MLGLGHFCMFHQAGELFSQPAPFWRPDLIAAGQENHAGAAEAQPCFAEQSARQQVAGRLGQPGTYAATMARLGYSEREITEVSDRLVDAIVGYGDAARIAAKVREHLAAGADHVLVMPTGTDFEGGVDQLEQLAPRWPSLNP